MDPSNIPCGNCEEEITIDSDGESIQPCPDCGSPEMVKGVE